MYYRITTYDTSGKKDVITEDDDFMIIEADAETALWDLSQGNLNSVVVSRITGKTGMRDNL